ncbi:MAG: hypothetical protein WCS41_01470 [Candidatus Paceibacterota bacterium]
MPFLALAFVILLIGVQIKKRTFLEKKIKKIFWIPVAAVFSLSVIFSFIQYQLWLAGEQTKYFLPPFVHINSFLLYAFFQFFAPYILAFMLSVLLFLLMKKANKKYGARFFEKDEIYIAFLGGFLSGFPGFLFYLFGVVAAYLIIHLYKSLIKGKKEVIPLYYLWLPVSAFVIINNILWLSRTGLWKILSI